MKTLGPIGPRAVGERVKKNNLLEPHMKLESIIIEAFFYKKNQKCTLDMQKLSTDATVTGAKKLSEKGQNLVN